MLYFFCCHYPQISILTLQSNENLKFPWYHHDQKAVPTYISGCQSIKCFHAVLLNLAKPEAELSAKVTFAPSDCLNRQLHNLPLVRLEIFKKHAYMSKTDLYVFKYWFVQKTAFKIYTRSKNGWLFWDILVVSVSSVAFMRLYVTASEEGTVNWKQYFTDFWSLLFIGPGEMESSWFQNWN